MAADLFAPPGSCPRILQLTLAKPAELSVGWLDTLPHAEKLCAHVCLKGMKCKSDAAESALRSLKRIRIHSCIEEPGGHENGHEGVCAYRFLLDNYDLPWNNVYFLHGDIVTGHHAGQFHSFKRFLAADVWPPWPKTRAEITHDHCGCGHWGSDLNPFGPRDFWFNVLSWWLGQMITPRDPHARELAERWAASADCNRRSGVCGRYGVGAWPLHNGTLSSPLGFMFAVDRAAALQRSRRFLQAQYRICKVGVRVLPPGNTLGAPNAARLSPPAFDYNPLVYGHVNERIPFFIFGHEFEERPVPDCLFEGHHANMNCTQPEATRGGGGGGGGGGSEHHHHHRGNSNASLPVVTPSHSWGCKPFDRGCGSIGR